VTKPTHHRLDRFCHPPSHFASVPLHGIHQRLPPGPNIRSDPARSSASAERATVTPAAVLWSGVPSHTRVCQPSAPEADRNFICRVADRPSQTTLFTYALRIMAGDGDPSSSTTTTTPAASDSANNKADAAPTPSTSTPPPAEDGPSSSSPAREPPPEQVPHTQQNGEPNTTDMHLVEIPDSVDFLNGSGDMNGIDHVMGEIVDMNATTEDVHGWSEGDNHELKRVKVCLCRGRNAPHASTDLLQVYELIGSRWVDQGTAFCSGHYDEQLGEAALLARSENDFDTIILKTTIRPNDVYQRQQETLIVWTEPNGVDYALSFQDPEGCSEVWSFIMDVQPHIQGVWP
jgi:hypothetical protein